MHRRRVARACLAALDDAHPSLPSELRAVAATVAEQAGLGGRAAALLVELRLDALRRGALATAVTTLGEALDGTPDASTRRSAQVGLVDALARVGRIDECLAVGSELLAQTPATNLAARVDIQGAPPTVDHDR